jgi:hypothetical protein
MLPLRTSPFAVLKKRHLDVVIDKIISHRVKKPAPKNKNFMVVSIFRSHSWHFLKIKL